MIHADLHSENLMVDGERLTGIDSDDAGFGWHQYDLAVALHEYQHREDFALLEQAMIRGYRQERSLADRDLALVPLFLLVRTLALMGWTHARPELSNPKRMPRLIDAACRDIVALGLGTMA
jgi:Ser/Thr protein kinase RdoA (MazF antagonist)